MKKRFLKICAIICVVFVVSVIFFGCNDHTTKEKYQLIRIHVRADSNEQAAQDVKMKVVDRVSSYLTNALNGISDRDAAYEKMSALLQDIKAVADGVLKAQGFSYQCKVKLNNEYFPSRTYDGLVVDSGYYDALIIELGTGKGDNWWCVIYPPLCYLEGEGEDFKYKSWIEELIHKFFG